MIYIGIKRARDFDGITIRKEFISKSLPKNALEWSTYEDGNEIAKNLMRLVRDHRALIRNPKGSIPEEIKAQKELRDRQDKLKREYSASPENCKNNMLLMAIDGYQYFL